MQPQWYPLFWTIPPVPYIRSSQQQMPPPSQFGFPQLYSHSYPQPYTQPNYTYNRPARPISRAPPQAFHMSAPASSSTPSTSRYPDLGVSHHVTNVSQNIQPNCSFWRSRTNNHRKWSRAQYYSFWQTCHRIYNKLFLLKVQNKLFLLGNCEIYDIFRRRPTTTRVAIHWQSLSQSHDPQLLCMCLHVPPLSGMCNSHALHKLACGAVSGETHPLATLLLLIRV